MNRGNPVVDHIALGQPAPDFELTDVAGRIVRLSDYKGSKNVVLVFTRGFL
jgi:peroxiredoxin